MVRGTAHSSIGASTAVFGCLGVLVARAGKSIERREWRRWVVPLGAGAGLLAMTGVGGERTDYLAHLFGFGWGLIVGVCTMWSRSFAGPRRRVISSLVGVSSLAVLIAAWSLAIRGG